MDFDIDRPRGMLSKADREYLLGEAEMTHEQSKRNAEARIRNRVHETIVDFNLLVHSLTEKDRRQVFEAAASDPEFVRGLRGMLSFTYLGLKETGVEFEHVLEPAVRKAEEVHAAGALSSTVGVDVTFDVTTHAQTTIDDVTARIRDGGAVTPGELFSVVVGDDDSLADVESILVQCRGNEEREAEFVARLADFFDAEVEDRPLNRVRLRIRPDASGAEPSSATRE